jgi:hypothetical protein
MITFYPYNKCSQRFKEKTIASASPSVGEYFNSELVNTLETNIIGLSSLLIIYDNTPPIPL